MRRIVITSLLVVAFCVPGWAQDPVSHPKRVALVIGNGNYQIGNAPLGPGNPFLVAAVNDANAVAAELRTLQFDVLTGTDRTLAQMKSLIDQFKARLTGADQALFYYSGHGAQVKDHNYLLPVDAGDVHDNDFATKTVDVEAIYRALGSGDSGFNLIILDACRTNPFLAAGGGDLPQGAWLPGLAEPKNVPPGTIVAFATSPGHIADDTGVTSSHSPYAVALLRYMGEPGLAVQDFFLKVHNEFDPHQTPWENTSQKTPFMFRDPAYVEVVMRGADDEATLIAGDGVMQWTIDNTRKRLIRLHAGDNVLRMTVFNQKTRHGIVGPREGWNYSVLLTAHDQLEVPPQELRGGETGATDHRALGEMISDLGAALFGGGIDLSTGNVAIPEPPLGPGETAVRDEHWGRGFIASMVRIHVDPEGHISFPIVDDRIWDDGFTIADPSRDILDRSIAWSIAHEGVRLYDDSDNLRPLPTLQSELAGKHQQQGDDNSHGKARSAILAADSDLLRTTIAITRAFERAERGGFIADLKWAMANSPAFKTAYQQGDSMGMRKAFFDSQTHNPDVRNELALLSNTELKQIAKSSQ